MKLTYEINAKPPKKLNLTFAFQQMIAIMAATLLVPMLMTLAGLPSDPAAALFGAGLGTVFYLLCTKFRSPVFLGSSFTFVPAYSASIAAGYGYWGVIIGVGFAFLTYALVSLVIKLLGSGWVNKLMPASIAGPIVALIGLSLAGTATGWMSSNGGDNYSLLYILVGIFTFFAIVYCSVRGSKSMKMFPFIFGVGAGYLLALVLTLIGNAAGIAALQIISFDSFKEAFVPFTFSSILRIPDFYLVRAIATNGEYVLDGNAILNMVFIYVPIAIVDLAQHVGDHKNLGNIVNRDLITDPGLHRTILGDGLGSFIGTMFGACANTTYGESIACTAITGNASTYTILTTCIGCMLLSLLTPFVAFLNSIPKCVIGGACVAMYGFISVSGLQLLSKVDLGDNRNLYPVAAILVCGVGGLTLNFGHNPVTGGYLISFTSLAVAMLVGILTKAIVGHGTENDSLGASIKTLGELELTEEEK